MARNWKEITELAGIVAIVVSLVFVGMQLQQTQAVAIAEMDANDLANQIEESNLMIENADVWVRGNADEELTPVESVIYERLIQITNNSFYSVIQQYIGLVGSEEIRETFIVEFAAFLYENPGARRVWRAREERLKHYKETVNPEDQVSSDWIELIESTIRSFEETAHAAPKKK